MGRTTTRTPGSLSRLLSDRSGDLALVIGNGINRYKTGATNSWTALLTEIAGQYAPELTAVPTGTALTEFYDVLELRLSRSTVDLQSAFCDLILDWRPFDHHRRIIRWAKRHRSPVLTTNFDEVLSLAGECRFQRPRNPNFTDYYPWEGRFADELIDDPCAGFGIWHVNGMARYKRSVRLSLSHYMGSVQRARSWLHGNSEAHLFGTKDRRGWPGADTWVHVFFNKPLLIFGLGLDENEVFFRWLLIERAKYFRKFPDRQRAAWYVYRDEKREERQAGKLFFLQAVGIQCVRSDNFAEIYDNQCWDD